MKLQKSPFDKTGLGFMNVETFKGQTKQEKNAHETNKTKTAARGPDETQTRVPPIGPEGSARSAAAVTHRIVQNLLKLHIKME
jgi:hypothetical protein